MPSSVVAGTVVVAGAAAAVEVAVVAGASVPLQWEQLVLLSVEMRQQWRLLQQRRHSCLHAHTKRNRTKVCVLCASLLMFGHGG